MPNLAGIEIEWRVNVLALAAFILSVVSIGYNLVGFFQGARVEQLPVRQVILYAKTVPSGDVPILSEDQEDLNTFSQRAEEATLSYEELLEDLKLHGKI